MLVPPVYRVCAGWGHTFQWLLALSAPIHPVRLVCINVLSVSPTCALCSAGVCFTNTPNNPLVEYGTLAVYGILYVYLLQCVCAPFTVYVCIQYLSVLYSYLAHTLVRKVAYHVTSVCCTHNSNMPSR